MYSAYDEQQAQALQNWYAKALESAAQNPMAADSVAAQSPFQPAMARALPENYAQSSSGTVMDFGQSAPRASDVWQSGAQVLRRQQQADGTFLVTKRVPTYDGEGRQSAVVVQDVEIPDHLNPAKIQEVKYKQMLKELNSTGRAADLRLVDGQWILPPSSDNPTGRALPVEGFQRRSTDKVAQTQANAEQAKSRVDELLSKLQGH